MAQIDNVNSLHQHIRQGTRPPQIIRVQEKKTPNGTIREFLPTSISGNTVYGRELGLEKLNLNTVIGDYSEPVINLIG